MNLRQLMILLFIFLSGPFSSATSCEPDLISDYVKLTRHGLDSRMITPAQLREAIASETPRNPIAEMTVDSKSQYLAKALDRATEILSPTDWPAVRATLTDDLSLWEQKSGALQNSRVEHEIVTEVKLKKSEEPNLEVLGVTHLRDGRPVILSARDTFFWQLRIDNEMVEYRGPRNYTTFSPVVYERSDGSIGVVFEDLAEHGVSRATLSIPKSILKMDSIKVPNSATRIKPLEIARDYQDRIYIARQTVMHKIDGAEEHRLQIIDPEKNDNSSSSVKNSRHYWAGMDITNEVNQIRGDGSIADFAWIAGPAGIHIAAIIVRTEKYTLKNVFLKIEKGRITQTQTFATGTTAGSKAYVHILPNGKCLALFKASLPPKEHTEVRELFQPGSKPLLLELPVPASPYPMQITWVDLPRGRALLTLAGGDQIIVFEPLESPFPIDQITDSMVATEGPIHPLYYPDGRIDLLIKTRSGMSARYHLARTFTLKGGSE